MSSYDDYIRRDKRLFELEKLLSMVDDLLLCTEDDARAEMMLERVQRQVDKLRPPKVRDDSIN